LYLSHPCDSYNAVVPVNRVKTKLDIPKNKHNKTRPLGANKLNWISQKLPKLVYYSRFV